MLTWIVSTPKEWEMLIYQSLAIFPPNYTYMYAQKTTSQTQSYKQWLDLGKSSSIFTLKETELLFFNPQKNLPT
jgi:hypothetical protein